MDYLTQRYYEENASRLAPAYAEAGGGISAWFETAFPEGCRVLDVGASSGRDVDRLLRGGRDASGVDPGRAFLKEAVARFPHLKGRMWEDSLPNLPTIPDASVGGVLCAAVLMHLAEDQMEGAFQTLRRILRPGGTLLTSLPVDSKGRPVRIREFGGRLFNGLSPSALEESLESLGFSAVARGRSLDSMGRPERQWVTQLFALKPDGD